MTYIISNKYSLNLCLENTYFATEDNKAFDGLKESISKVPFLSNSSRKLNSNIKIQENEILKIKSNMNVIIKNINYNNNDKDVIINQKSKRNIPKNNINFINSIPFKNNSRNQIHSNGKHTILEDKSKLIMIDTENEKCVGQDADEIYSSFKNKGIQLSNTTFEKQIVFDNNENDFKNIPIETRNKNNQLKKIIKGKNSINLKRENKISFHLQKIHEVNPYLNLRSLLDYQFISILDL